MPASPPESMPSALAARLAEAHADWRRLPLIAHVLVVVVLSLVPFLRNGVELVDLGTALPDENPYFMAFDRVAVGDSPFGGTHYLYPSVFAYGGAFVQERLGRGAIAAFMRVANLLGVGMAVWLALSWLPLTIGTRTLAGAAYILVSPPINFGVLLGNASLAVTGLTLAALYMFRSRPVLAGTLLGGGIALKPIAVMAVPALAAYRTGRGRCQQLVAASVAIAVVALLVLCFPYLREFLELASTSRVGRSVTLHRFPGLFGLEVNAFWISVPIALLVLLYLHRHPLGPAHALCLMTTAALAVTPLVWSHTLLLALPLQVLALTVVVSRFAASRSDGAGVAVSRRAFYEMAFVLLGIAGIQFARGAGNIGDQGALLQAVAASVPALSPAALTIYVFRTTESF
ncbi:MAG: hypothetical protein OEQ13_02225 [Acidobacteriota bacterium]|nr:hypothetical protein [Acidobacteriota bacterium]